MKIGEMLSLELTSDHPRFFVGWPLNNVEVVG